MILVIKPAALKYLLKHRADTFGNSPIVFCNVGKHEKVLDRLPPGVAGAVVDYAVRLSLDLIQKLQPDTHHVVIVLGASTREAQLWELARSQIASSGEKLPIEPWAGLTTEESRTRLASLPRHTAVLYVSEFKDRDGPYFAPSDYLAEVAPYSKVPIYSLGYTYLGIGTVGGRLVDPVTDAKIAADFAVRILK